MYIFTNIMISIYKEGIVTTWWIYSIPTLVVQQWQQDMTLDQFQAKEEVTRLLTYGGYMQIANKLLFYPTHP